MTYDVRLTRSAARQVEKLSGQIRARVAAALDRLTTEPRPIGAERLSGTDEPIYRIRVSDYRILYSISDAELIVLIVRVGHRRDVYRGK